MPDLPRFTPFRRALITASTFLLAVMSPCCAHAQRHSFGSSPPTAPLRLAAPALPAPPAGPIAAVSTGMGAIQFQPANFVVPAPQTLTRQLQAEDERTRAGALSSLGAPGQYIVHGRVPFPHSVQLDLVQLGQSDELDALLTVELDQHIVSAVLIPEGESWRRVATLQFATAFSNATATPATFARPLRSWLEPGRYRAVYHASVSNSSGDFTENEADLRIVNNRAVVILDFVSGARQCDASGQIRPPHQTCELIQRWLEPEPTNPTHHFSLITGLGHFSAHEASDPLSQSRNYRLTHLRSFTCQPFVFSDASMHFEPTANATPCGVHDPPHEPVHTDHP
ncbi:MAG: hypothetical protein ACRYFU_02410 [Janthinobacterium lividum]